MDDFKKLATGNVLFNLKRIISPKLVTILYFLGLAAILLWAVNHLFSTFRFGFGSGLWGLLEIAVFGLLGLVVLRIVCEAVIVYFGAHAERAEEYAPVRASGSLIDDVRDAIEELAEDETDTPLAQSPSPVAPRTEPSNTVAPVAEEPAIMQDPDAPKPGPAAQGPAPQA